MREAHEREQTVGIDWYVVDTPGIGGRLRSRHGDFRVREIETVSPVATDADPGSYPHLLVRARLVGWDTNDFVRRLSTAMGIGRERISWAGTKDKRAVTTQLFSIRDATPADLPSVDDAELTVVGRIGRDLTFGDLAGNAFEIRVRDTGHGDGAGERGESGETDGSGAADGDTNHPVAALVDDLATWWRDESSTDGTSGGAGEDGPVPGTARITDSDARVDENVPAGAARRAVAVPNWFGHQRFGSRRPVTHEVGLRLAAGDPRGAVLTYAGNPAPTEPTETRAARAAVDREAARERPDWSGTLAWYPDRLRFERSMLHRLADEGRTDESDEGDSPVDTATDATADADTDGSADTEWLDHERVAPEDRRWWDAVAAVPENLQRLFVNAAQSYLFNRIVSERLRRGLPLHRPVEGDVVCFRDGDDERVARPDPDRTQRATADRVDVLTRHCERGRAFVTAPLVGHETELAEGEPGEIEREVLADAGVEPADFALPGAFDSSGTRRALLVGTDVAVERVDDDPVFAFALPSGAYATALLREVLQRDPTEL